MLLITLLREASLKTLMVALLRLRGTCDSPEVLGKHRADSLGRGWSLGIRIANKSPGDANASGPQTTLKSRFVKSIYKANPTSVWSNMALFCQMASEEPWCFLEHSGTVLRDGMIIFPGIAAKIAPGHIKDGDGGFRYTMWGSPKLSPQFCKQEVHCSAKEGVHSSRKQSPFVRQNFGMSPMTLEATAVLT